MIAEPDQRLPDHPRLLGQPPEPPVIRMHRLLKAEVEKTPRLTIHQGRYSKPVEETTELSQRGSTLLKVYEVRLHTALCKKAQCFASVRTLSCPEYLNLPNL